MILEDLASAHYGETIWVLGSGPSLNYIDGSLFDDKTTVSTNFSARALGVRADYAFTHYHGNAADLLKDTMTVVTLAKSFQDNTPFPGPVPTDIVLAEQDSYTPPGGSWNPLTTHPPRKDSLAYGSSSLHGAMHLAAHLGASHIILVGADCGQIDGEDRVTNYEFPGGHALWTLYDHHHQLMKQYLEQKYPVRIHSLNPFINLNLEGHSFRGASTTA